MRRFVVVGHKATSSGNFKLEDMAGGAGRLDILIRCINSAFFLSHSIRKDVEIYLVVLGGEDAPKTIRIVGSEVKYLNPDERSTGALIRNALMMDVEDREMRSSPGIYISRDSFYDVINRLSARSKIVYLRENGVDVQKAEFSEDVTFVLSDNQDLTSREDDTLCSLNPAICSLGPYSYHADHCIVIINNELDRREPNNA